MAAAMASETATLPAPPGLVDCAAYADGMRVAHVPLDDIAAALQRPGQFVWLGLLEPEQDLLRVVQQQFHLHDLAIEDAYNAHQRPKIEQYQDSLFVVLRTAQLAKDTGRLELGETHLFVGANYVITVRHGSMQSHVGLRARCECTPKLLAQGPGYVLYALMDFVVDQFLPIVEHFNDEVEEIEEEILDGVVNTESTARIYRLKRDLLALRRAVAPLVEVCNRLMRFDMPQIPPDTRPYFRDVYDHVMRVNETIDAQRELLTTALEAKLSLMSVAQNENMKRLTAYAAMIAVPTMIAGIYGMNFEHMPELSWRYGYLASLVVMALACGALWVGFKRSGWL
jgi:magnesium transporter